MLWACLLATNPKQIAKAVVEDAVFEKGCVDNCSAMLVQFSHPQQEPVPRVRPAPIVACGFR